MTSLMNRVFRTVCFAMRVGLAILCSLGGGAAILAPETSAAADPPRVEEDGTIHVPAFILPESSFLSEETRAALKQVRGRQSQEEWSKACPPMSFWLSRSDMPAFRCQPNAFYETSFYKSVRDRYPVVLTPQEMGGVYTEVFTPTAGIARKNEKRVLINVHGGGFQNGSRTFSHLESIPIASIGQIKVISVDYRMAPEYTFPAASEDVAAVYREVLKKYKPKNIGLYGCSAGGALTSQSIAWFQKEKLPLPGAIGLFCHGAGRALDAENDKWVSSDAAYISGALAGNYEKLAEPLLYCKGVDLRSPLMSPGDYDDIMRKVPPSLLISGTRDSLLSSVLVTHAQLVRLGVEADLHVWEGMEHAFHYFPQFPESREAYDVIVRFFDAHLGK